MNQASTTVPERFAQLCPTHGRQMRLGSHPGEWFCGRGFGFDHEGPCRTQTDAELADGLARWGCADDGADASQATIR